MLPFFTPSVSSLTLLVTTFGAAFTPALLRTCASACPQKSSGAQVPVVTAEPGPNASRLRTCFGLPRRTASWTQS